MAVRFTEEDRQRLLPILAACAKDCYFFERKHGLDKIAEELQEYRVEEHLGSKNTVQYAVYQLKSSPRSRILAFRGTKTARTILQDVCLLDPGRILGHYLPNVFSKGQGWHTIREIIKISQEAAEKIKPDYICGHSLGGLLAEVVASYLRIPGMSFNSPGPVGLVTETSFLNYDTSHYRGLPFEIHLRENDPVSQVNYEHHINTTPIWHPGSSHHMDDLVKDIWRDHSVVVEHDGLTTVAGPLLTLNHRKDKKKGRKILKNIFRRE